MVEKNSHNLLLEPLFCQSICTADAELLGPKRQKDVKCWWEYWSMQYTLRESKKVAAWLQKWTCIHQRIDSNGIDLNLGIGQ